MTKRLTTDESFKCYLKAKIIATMMEDEPLLSFLEDFFLRQMDYDLWEEGEEGAKYCYPWNGEYTRYFKKYGVTRKGTSIFYEVDGKPREVTYKGTEVFLDGESIGNLTSDV